MGECRGKVHAAMLPLSYHQCSIRYESSRMENSASATGCVWRWHSKRSAKGEYNETKLENFSMSSNVVPFYYVI